MRNSPPVKNDIFGKYASGTLDLCLAENFKSKEGRNLDVSIDGSYFCAIYADSAKKFSDEMSGENEYTAKLGLRKLIYCCDEALKDNLPLLFVCD